jgi:hypothetical protein
VDFDFVFDCFEFGVAGEELAVLDFGEGGGATTPYRLMVSQNVAMEVRREKVGTKWRGKGGGDFGKGFLNRAFCRGGIERGVGPHFAVTLRRAGGGLTVG